MLRLAEAKQWRSDIQSWWEVPSIAHFCSLFRTAFSLLDFDIEDLEEALLTDGTEESSWLQELIVLLLKGCLPNNEISLFNYQMFLRRLFRKKCQEHDLVNPFNTDEDFQLLPLRVKVDILQALCDFRLEADDVLEQLKNLEADSLRVEPLGYDINKSAYWYFYGTRLYREDNPETKKAVWQVICFTLNDWNQFVKKLENSKCKAERQLFHTLNENFIPELPRLFKEKESLARKRLLEKVPRRTSNRLRYKGKPDDNVDKCEENDSKKSNNGRHQIYLEALEEQEEYRRAKEEEERKQKELRERLSKSRNEVRSRRTKSTCSESQSDCSDSRHEMAGAKTKDKKSKRGQNKETPLSDTSSRNRSSNKGSANVDKSHNKAEAELKPVGRQTNNSLASATGQILIQPVSNPHRKKLKTSQVFSQSEEDLQTGLHKILDHVKNHDDAWPFIEPVEEEYAPNYYSIIRKPMDLQRMEERLDAGHYKTFSKFKTDFQLIVNNCRLYNGVDNEYTEMVDNLLEVFNRAVERYLDQITSSDEEIAVEYPDAEQDKSNKKKRVEAPVPTPPSKRKPTLAAQTDRKKDNTPEDSIGEESNYESEEEEPRSLRKNSRKEDISKGKKEKVEKEKEKEKIKVNKKEKEKESNKKRKNVSEERELPKSKKQKASEEKEVKSRRHKEISEEKEIKTKHQDETKNNKKHKEEVSKKNKKEVIDKKSKEKEKEKLKKTESKKQHKSVLEEKKPVKKPGRKPKKSPSLSPVRSRSRSFSRSLSRDRWSSSPPPSWPPTSPESRFDVSPKKNVKKGYYSSEDEEIDNKGKHKQKNDKWKEIFKDDRDHSPSPPKHKDKHNKLRETIEKLKAKSDLSKLKERDLKVYDFDFNKTKENHDVSKTEKNKKEVFKKKNKVGKKEDYEDDNSTADSTQSDNKNKTKKTTVNSKSASAKNSTIEALTLATEQTLKDINKWLDDTPRFPEFSSASNSPSHFSGIDEFDSLNNKTDDKKKIDRPAVRKDGVKDIKKRPFQRDPTKMFRRREVQRTIDRLQPGKSKGNLITNVKDTAKPDDLFPLGPLSKIKDTKNSLIVKTDESAPKLSLGSVLDSFGKHKFVDDEAKKEEEKKEAAKEESSSVVQSEVKKEEVKEESKADPPKLDNSPGKATPNLSAWFKAFGAPKVQPTVKKPESKEEKPEAEPKKEEIISTSVKKVPIPDPSPNPDSPVMHGQPAPRQRKISTGSSMSERSSFSQDMDSPRVGIDERLGAYPAPYPSPLHKSPSGASPNLRSPLPDASPKANTYPPFNGQIRVGFYQDTVSTKSSPDKSCSPRDNPQSPYTQYSEHVYTPQTTPNSGYSYSNPYYTHPPSYSTSNPTPPYNPEQSNQSYYDTNKPLTDQYQAKNSVSSPVNINPNSSSVSPQQPSPSINHQKSPSVETYKQAQPSPSVDMYNQQNSPSLETYNQNQQASSNLENYQTEPPQNQQQTQDDFNKITQSAPSETFTPHQPTNMEAYRSQQPNNIDAYRQTQQQQVAPNVEPFRTEVQIREKQQQTASFPVKKRAYSEIDQVNRFDEQYNRTNLDIGLMQNRLTNEQQATSRDATKYIHQNIPEPRNISGQQQPLPQNTQATSQESTAVNMHNVNFPPSNNPYNYNDSYPINIPSATRTLEGDRQVDMSKFTNMGYTGSEMNFPRNSSQFNKQAEINYPKLSSAATEQATNQRYPENNVMNIGNYKQNQTPHLSTTSTADNSNANSRLEASRLENFKPEVSIPRPTYGSATSSLELDQSLALRGNLANLTHIVDRYQNEERMLSTLQSGAPAYYADKNITPQHMFTKPISSNSSGLPIFSQPSTMPYSHNIQPSTTMYNRPMSELQNSSMLGQERSTSLQQQIQDKKSKRRKTTKTATPPTSAIDPASSTPPVQGFQSYTGLKNSTSMEPSAISLKTASVVPGSAFNFGPSATGLGLGTGLYGDKDAYPNFLEDFRSAPNYYMAAAAAAHHRSTPENSEKQTRTAHQPANPQAPPYPFIGAPQPRPPSYPLGAPFMATHQGSLMDANSPLYQQYLQAGVLHQGLLGPPGAYPPGYHPALSMRQPYDSMTRPSWL